MSAKKEECKCGCGGINNVCKYEVWKNTTGFKSKFEKEVRSNILKEVKELMDKEGGTFTYNKIKKELEVKK